MTTEADALSSLAPVRLREEWLDVFQAQNSDLIAQGEDPLDHREFLACRYEEAIGEWPSTFRQVAEWLARGAWGHR